MSIIDVGIEGWKHASFLLSRIFVMRFFIFLSLISCCFAADEELPRSSPEQIAASRRDFLISDTVSPFSGQVVLHERDMIVNGAEPLFVDRSFNPFCPYFKLEEGELPRSANVKGNSDWQIYPHIFLRSKRTHFHITDSCGMTYEFIKLSKHHDSHLHQKAYGICNACGEEVSGKFDVRNTKIISFDNLSVQILRPDGTEQFYKTNLPGNKFVLEREILPNGKVIRYYYNKGELYQIESQDPKGRYTYARIKINKDTFNSSSGQTLQYVFKDLAEPKIHAFTDGFNRPILTNVQSVFYPSESYFYNQDLLLKEVNGRKCRYLCNYRIFGTKKTPREHRQYRVTGLCFQGSDQDACFIDYNLPEAGKSPGETIVTQKDGLKVIYGISSQLLPSYIQWWDKEELKKEKKFNWSADQKLESVLMTDGKRTIYERKFSCDGFGNPIKEQVIDYLANQTHTIQRKFSQDGKQLLLEELNDDGKKVVFEYEDKTNLVKSKEVFDGKDLLIKEISVYDDCYNLIKKIVKGKGNYHRITKYTLRQQDPFLHMPEWVEELYVENDKEFTLTKVHLHYDQWGNVNKEEWFDADDVFSYAIERTYDERGKLLTETNPIGQQAIYKYDEHGRCISSVSFSHRLTTKKKYDQKGRLIKTTDCGDDDQQWSKTFFYDVCDHLVEEKDKFDHSTFYSYDPVSKKAISSYFPATNLSTFSSYDCLGRETSYTDGNKNKIVKTFNCYDLPLTFIYPDNTKESFTYTKTGKLKTAVDEDGQETTYEYDVLGRMTSKKRGFYEEQWQYDGFNLLTYIDKGKKETYYFYDGAGRKIKEIQGPKSTLFTYDSLGRVETIRFNDVLLRTFKRDLKGRILEETDSTVDGSLLSQKNYGYDGDGNCISLTTYVDENPAVERKDYDCFGRLIQEIDPANNVTSYEYDETFVNEKGQRVLKKTTTNSQSVKTIEIFDPTSKLVKKEIISSEGVHLSYSYEYDSCGNLLFKKNDLSEIADAFSYSSRNWQTEAIRALGTSCERKTLFTYTPKGKCLTKTMPDGISLTYIYDDQDFIEQLISSDGTINHHFTRNAVGDVIKAEDKSNKVVIEREVDQFGNILKEHFPDGRRLEMTYDPFDRLLTLDFGSGQIGYSYDGAYLRKVSRFDGEGRLLYAHSYDLYDKNGLLQEETLICNAGANISTYDLCGRKSSSKSNYFKEDLSYDSVGNVIEKEINGLKASLRYDALSQLIQENKTILGYDNHFNRIRKNDQELSYNALDECELFGEKKCHYDLRGNPKTKDGFDFAFDALDRLVEAKNGNGTVKFTYDPFGRVYNRIFSIDGKALSTNNFLYQGTEEIGAFVDGKLRQLKVLGFHRLPVAIELDDEVFIPMLDSQRNVVGLVDANTKEVREIYSYTAFGEEFDSGFINPWRFASKRYDSFLGHINFGHRFYDPILGRWLTKDPEGFRDSDNLYLYLHNNPYRYFDPDGRFVVALPLLVFGAEIAFTITVTKVVVTTAVLSAAYAASKMYNRYLHKDDVSQNYQEYNAEIDEEDPPRYYQKRDDVNEGKDKKHSPEQQAINDLVKESGKKGVTNKEADHLIEWSNEYNFPSRDDRGKPPHWVGGEHIHIGNKHVPVRD